MNIKVIRSCGNFELERIPTLQLVLLLFGHPPHQSFIIFSPKRSALNSVTYPQIRHSTRTRYSMIHLGVAKVTDIGRRLPISAKNEPDEVFGFTDRTIHRSQLGQASL